MTLFLRHKVEEAIEFLRHNEPPEGYTVKFSGGKDSIVVYDLVKRSGVGYGVFYNCTTLDAPELTRFIRKQYPEVKWLFPRKHFYQYLMTKGLPTKEKRWCCEKLKHGIHPQDASSHIVVGIRAEESKSRAKRGMISEFGKQMTYSPIFNFDEEDVWDYIEESDLPYPELYDEGFTRLGCVVCPYICRSGGILQKHKLRWPAHYRKFEAVAAEYYEKKKGFFRSRGILTAGHLLELWYASKPIPVTEERNRQLRMFALR